MVILDMCLKCVFFVVCIEFCFDMVCICLVLDSDRLCCIDQTNEQDSIHLER